MARFEPARLDGVGPAELDVVGYRNQAPGFDPRSGEGARRLGGQFNPSNSFPVIYLCLTRPCVVAELTRQAERQSVQVNDLLPRELWSVEAELTEVLDLTKKATLAAAALDEADLMRPDHALTQQIGEAAHDRNVQAIRNRSVTGVDDVLAIFPQNLGATILRIELLETWTAVDDL